jgi:hypothetical protein
VVLETGGVYIQRALTQAGYIGKGTYRLASKHKGGGILYRFQQIAAGSASDVLNLIAAPFRSGNDHKALRTDNEDSRRGPCKRIKYRETGGHGSALLDFLADGEAGLGVFQCDGLPDLIAVSRPRCLLHKSITAVLAPWMVVSPRGPFLY